MLFEQYEILAREMLKREAEGRPFTFYHYMLDLEGGAMSPQADVRLRLGGTEYLAVTPWGSSSPATSSSTTRPTPWGTCGRGSPTPPGGRSSTGATWWPTPPAGTAGPGSTAAGGCAANAYHASGDINGTYEYGCELFKKRIECAIMIKAAQAGRPR